MRFDGSIDVPAPPERVWLAMLDVPSIATCVPGIESLQDVGGGAYVGVATTRLGPIAARFDLKGALMPDEASRTARVAVQGRERLTGTRVEATFEAKVRAVDAESAIDYTLDISLLGRLGQMGQAVFQDVARSITDRTAACLRERLAGG
ncbi:MAG: hypothetical protein EPO26_13570 [Chloroflexota bacterium]|nr:MAG: hypothetical protein EPO26_13570 [Chloroflexota bacterium]